MKMSSNDKDDKVVISDHAKAVAARVWCTPQTELKLFDPVLAEEIAKVIEEYRQALIWCGGSADFGYGGKSHEGWKKVCETLLRDGVG